MTDQIEKKQLSLMERPTRQLLNDFGAGKASPGSGSAAALMGLLAIKLLVTVCEKSTTKPECDKATFAYLKEQIQSIEPKLIELFEKDAKEFDEVVALRIARDKATSSQEKAKFSRQSQELLETATDNAFQIIDNCMKLIDYGVIAFESGWHAVRGDSGAALSASIAGVMSGIFIANLNLKTLKGRKYALENVDRCDQLYKELTAKQTKAFSCVTSLNAEAIEAIQIRLDDA